MRAHLLRQLRPLRGSREALLRFVRPYLSSKRHFANFFTPRSSRAADLFGYFSKLIELSAKLTTLSAKLTRLLVKLLAASVSLFECFSSFIGCLKKLFASSARVKEFSKNLAKDSKRFRETGSAQMQASVESDANAHSASLLQPLQGSARSCFRSRAADRRSPAAPPGSRGAPPRRPASSAGGRDRRQPARRGSARRRVPRQRSSRGAAKETQSTSARRGATLNSLTPDGAGFYPRPTSFQERPCAVTCRSRLWPPPSAPLQRKRKKIPGRRVVGWKAVDGGLACSGDHRVSSKRRDPQGGAGPGRI